MIDLGKDINKRRGGILSIKVNEGEELVKQSKNVRFAKDSIEQMAKDKLAEFEEKWK